MPKSGDESIVNESQCLPSSLQRFLNCKTATVTQHVDCVEVIPFCYSRPTRYSIYLDGLEAQALYVQEVGDCYARQILGAARGFSLKFSDDDLVDILRVVRPMTCSRGCCGSSCCLPSLEVECPPGQQVAVVRERQTWCSPQYDITDMEGQLLYHYRPWCCYPYCVNLFCDISVHVINKDSVAVAEIVKKTKGNCGDCLGMSNNFDITYKQDLTAKDKLILLGSVFLMDYHYFEKQNRCYC